jgi:hypothetical protein
MTRWICFGTLSLLLLLGTRTALAQGAETVHDVLICENVQCRCDRPGETQECESVTCWCVDDPPRGQPIQAPNLPDRPVVAQQFPREPVDREQDRRRIPRILDRPVSSAGFTLTGSRANVLIELGYPFLDLRFTFRLHDRVSLALGYRGLYTLTNGGYAAFKFGLYRNRASTVGLSLTLAGGYSHSQEEWFDSMVGGNSGYGEANLALTRRWGRHSFDAIIGTRLAWVREQCTDEEYYDYDECWDAIFDGGAEGLLAILYLDLGWSMRILPFFSYYLTAGIDAFTNADESPHVLPRIRMGFMIDF